MEKMTAWCLFVIALCLVRSTSEVQGRTCSEAAAWCSTGDRSTPAKDVEPKTVAKFNSSKGTLYQESWAPIRGEVKSAPDGQKFLGHDALAVTPRDILAPPKMWMMVELYTGPPPLRAALYIRMDSLYLLGFRSDDGIVHCMPKYVNLFGGADPLPMEETYPNLTNTKPGKPVYPELAKVALGKAAARIATERLAGYRKGLSDKTLTKQAVLTFAIMISESLRIQSIQAACVRLWEQGGTLTEKDAKYTGAWSALSQLYTTGDLKSLSEKNRKKLSKIGVTTRAEAGNIIDFVYRPA